MRWWTVLNLAKNYKDLEGGWRIRPVFHRYPLYIMKKTHQVHKLPWNCQITNLSNKFHTFSILSVSFRFNAIQSIHFCELQRKENRQNTEKEFIILNLRSSTIFWIFQMENHSYFFPFWIPLVCLIQKFFRKSGGIFVSFYFSVLSATKSFQLS